LCGGAKSLAHWRHASGGSVDRVIGLPVSNPTDGALGGSGGLRGRQPCCGLVKMPECGCARRPQRVYPRI